MDGSNRENERKASVDKLPKITVNGDNLIRRSDGDITWLEVGSGWKAKMNKIMKLNKMSSQEPETPEPEQEGPTATEGKPLKSAMKIESPLQHTPDIEIVVTTDGEEGMKADPIIDKTKTNAVKESLMTTEIKKSSSQLSVEASQLSIDEDDDDDDGSKTDMEAKIEKELNKKQLLRLEQMFIEADADGGGTLDIEEFVAAMQTLMPHLSQRELELLFMKIDANCDENVDWDEYLGYMLLEFQEKDIMQSMTVLKPFPRPKTVGHPFHKMTVIKLLLMPSMRHANKHKGTAKHLDYVNGTLLSISKDGMVNFWSPTLEHRKTEPMDLSLDKDTPGRRAINSQVWVLDACTMVNVNAIAVTTTNRDIHVYDVTGTSFWRRYQLVGFETCLGCINYWFDMDNMNHAIMLMGDNHGTVTAIVWHEALHGSGLFTKTSTYKKQIETQVIKLQDMLKGKCVTLTVVQMVNLHQDWVTSVKYFEKARNNFFLSCSSDYETAMYFGHISFEDPKSIKSGHYFKHTRGIICFEFRSYGNIIVTGHADGMIKMWDPFIPTHSVGVMKGHMVSVLQLQIDQLRDQLISVSKDNMVFIWNLKDNVALQTLAARTLFDQNTHRSISSMCFNPQTLSLAVATNSVLMLEQFDPKSMEALPISHLSEVTSTLYNDIFETVISTDIDSTISVFDVTKGQKTIQFINAHASFTHGMRAVEITATCLVARKTRLITGAADGTLKIWNFNNGQILRIMETEGNMEVTCIVFAKECIFVGGWNKRVTVFVDGVDNEAVDPLTKMWPMKHKEDIMSMAANEKLHLLLTGAYDGEIIIWNLDTGYLIFRLDASRSRFPITVWSLMALKEMGEIENTGKRLFANEDTQKHSILKGKTGRQHSTLVAGASRQDANIKKRTSKMSPETGDISGKRLSSLSPKSDRPGTSHSTQGITLPRIQKDAPSQSVATNEPQPSKAFGRKTSILSQKFQKEKNLKFEEEITSLDLERDSPDQIKMIEKLTAGKGLSGNGSGSSLFGKLMVTEKTKLPGEGLNRGVSIGVEEVIDPPLGDFDVNAEKYNYSVEKIMFLQTREQGRGTATVIAADSGGWIRAWSTHPQGGLMGQFRAAFSAGSGVLTITTDENETKLFTGDSTGHIQIWDIEGWCEEGKKVLCTMDSEPDDIAQHPYFQRFPYLLSIAKLRWKTYNSGLESLPNHLSAWETVKVPLRLNGWLAHTNAVIAIQFVNEKELIITSSSFGTIRLWTVMGSYIGAFGQAANLSWEIPELMRAPSEEKIESELNLVDSWGSLITLTESQVAAEEAKKNREQIAKEKHQKKKEQHVITDLLKVASALTLRVYNQGACPFWKYAKNIILIWCVRFAGNKVDDKHKNLEAEKVEEWSGVVPTSDILGITYHPIQRHKEPLEFKKLVRLEPNQMAVYHCVPLIPSMVETNQMPEIPKCVEEHQAEQTREKKILGSGKSRMILMTKAKGRSNKERTNNVKLPPI